MSTYDEMGGARAIGGVVAELYQRVLADERLAGYFDGVDLGRLRAHQRAFLTLALGGPNDYSGRPLAEAHAALDITDEAFDLLIEHLQETLRGRGLDEQVLAEVRAVLEPTRRKVVSDGRTSAMP